MNIIIPIGGIGQRFIDEGFTKPKPLINVLGEPMIKKVIQSLSITPYDTLHIVYNKTLDSYNFPDLLKHYFPSLDIKFYPIDRLTRGAAETVMLCLENLDEATLKEPFLIADGDTMYSDPILSAFEDKKSNMIFYTFNTDSNPIYSYIRLDKKERVIEIAEKVKISDYANTGAYGFKSGKKLKKYITQLLESETSKELYISQVYDLMLKNKEEILSHKVEGFHCVGTPLQLKVYSNIHKHDSKVLRLCFDFDNTLVSYPVKKGDYTSVQPIKKNIDLVRELYDLGHTIIIYTARRMRTHKGNVGKVTADIASVTLNTLSEFQIPYHEIYFGKPFADYYIDDLGIDAGGDLRKALGIWNTQTPSRDFNSVIYSDTKVTKVTNNPGEVFFYNNIPSQVKDLFPKVYETKKDSITMDYVMGVSYSKLMLDGSLTTDDLDTLILGLERLHSIPGKKVKLDIYKSYIDKVEKRYKENKEAYSWKSDIDSLYYRVVKALKYLKPFKPTIGVIHGDPVFTNVLKTHTGIKFIDMRGKVDDKLTLLGHNLYDLAKVYQSLLGYDFILEGLDLDIPYQLKLLNHFENKFRDNIVEIQIITASLFFSLLPLHSFDKEKFEQYLLIVDRLLNDTSH